MTKPIGRTARRSRRACVVVMRPEGNGRQGLLMESSMTEPVRRWLAKSNINTLTQFQRMMRGRRLRMVRGLGAWFVVSIGPDRALNRPKAVSGMTIDLRSLRVVSHKVLRWYCNDSGASRPFCSYEVINMGCPFVCHVLKFKDRLNFAPAQLEFLLCKKMKMRKKGYRNQVPWILLWKCNP